MNIKKKLGNVMLQNIPQQFPKSPQRITRTENNIYDDEFVILINGLNESIKEYYKVSSHNISETNTFISYFEEKVQEIQMLINEITNTNQYERINEFFEKINKMEEIMTQLQMNSDSSEKNLKLFFEDAKILFKKMKIKRNQKLSEFNSNINSNNNVLQIIHQSNDLNSFSSKIVNKNKSIFKQNTDEKSLNAINKIYSQIVTLLNKFYVYNDIIKEVNIGASNNFINLQNLLKKQLNILMNMFKNYFNNNKNITSFNSNNSYNVSEGQTNRKRSKSQINRENKEIQNLKIKLQLEEKKIKELTNKLNLYYNNNPNIRGNDSAPLSESKKGVYEMNNSNLNQKIMSLEKLLKEKNNLIISLKNNSKNGNNNFNNNLNLNNIISEKDNQIMNLKQELDVYQKNESLLNNQINDLSNNFQLKMNQYEKQISLINGKLTSLSKIIVNKNKEILKLQNENEKLNDIISRKDINNINEKNIDENFTNNNEDIIKRLKNEIENYKKMINQYENQIIELNINGSNNLNMNKINSNNNYILQKTIEKLKKDIDILTNKNKMYEQKINALNMKNNNKTYKLIEDQKITINQLNKEILNYKKKEKLNLETNNQYIKQIEVMNNNILSTNKILEQKDELIKQLNEKYNFQNKINSNEQLNNEINNNINNNEINNLKLENEKLKKQIEDLKLNKNNYLNNNNNSLLKDKIINGNDLKELQELNIQFMEENNAIKSQNNDLIEKIKQLTLKNNQMIESFNAQKENISKLESDIIKKNEELEGMKTFIFKLQSQLENKEDILSLERKKKEVPIKQFNSNTISRRGKGDFEGEQNSEINRKNSIPKKKNGNLANKSFDQKEDNTEMINNILNKLNDAEKKITTLQNKNKELQFKLEDKEVEKEISGFRTEDANFSNYEEEFDLKKMVNGARDKNRSEDINIDYPGVQGIKDKYKELLQNMNMLEEQVKILICNINCNNKIKPQITQICQLMRIPAKNIQLIISGKDKKKALGIID